jgi:hypothetical protein
MLAPVVFTVYTLLPQFSGDRECRGGAFSASDFSWDFDIRRCDFVVRRFGSEIGRVPF